MKVTTKYQCEFCQALYDTQKEAESCETTHCRIQQMIPQYSARRMPDRFLVRSADDTDGSMSWYSYTYDVQFKPIDGKKLEAKYNPKEGDKNAEGV